jgi:hypothetical protein
MTGRTYWLDLFTAKTWTEFLAAGATVSGFRSGRRALVDRVQPGDYLLCYVVGISRFVGLLEVQSGRYVDQTPIWSAEAFPERFRVTKLIELPLDTAVPIKDLVQRFTFWNPERPEFWQGKVQGSPNRWDARDGELIVEAMREAVERPVVRPFKAARLMRPAKKGGHQQPIPAVEPVYAADAASAADAVQTESTEVEPASERERAHVEMQWLLGQLGNDLGLDVWIPTGDRGFTFEGHALGDLRTGRLPMMFDERVTRRIRNIDLLWIKGSAIVAAFEVENSTSVYSGILRMADLIALAPGFRIPLYVVAPDERRRRVMGEVTRPTFERLDPPMSAACRFIPYSLVRDRLPDPAMRPFTSPNFLQGVSEACVSDED